MPKTTHRILALDPGTRKTGYALLQDGKLLYHGVKVFAKDRPPRENLREAREAVLGLITTLKPNVLAVERAVFSKRTPRTVLLNLYYRQILYLGRRANLKILAYAPSTVKKSVTGYGWATKQQVAQMVVYRYPELKAYLLRDRGWKSLHHSNMFDAVAVGLLALKDQ
ncbi:MAG: crossover junction endodeoxyribonuclease RuvC [Candidatus Hydrogenedentes bacterium]|nr:crossover junction endodeoxyribonuclease RuvC [Candidatus Hydrogenedentota bacterium]